MCFQRQIRLSILLALAGMVAAFAQSADEAEGFRLFAQGKNQQAAVLLEAASAAAPDRPDLARALGLCYLRLQNAEAARVAFARLFSVPADSAKAHLLTAKMMMGESLEEMAEPELRAALKLLPEIPEAHYMLGELAMYRGEADLSIEELQKEIAINPAFSMAYYRLGDAFSRKDLWNQTIAPLEKAIWLNPDFSSPYVLLGKAYYRLGRLPFAEGMLNRAVHMDPNNASAHYLLADVYRDMGRTEDARMELQTWKKLKEPKEK